MILVVILRNFIFPMSEKKENQLLLTCLRILFCQNSFNDKVCGHDNVQLNERYN